MSNYTMPPRSKASDYAKGKITQDEIIALQIANDANIAAARKAYKMGIPPQVSPLQTASPDELLADDSAQEAMARTNLERLGFRPQEAAQIIADIRTDPVLDFTSLNANFPAIETDIKARFNIKLLTPSFFMNYLRQYKIELDASRGLSATAGGVSALVNTIGELRQVLPSPEQFREILIRIRKIRISTQQSALLTPVLERIQELQNALPDPAEYQRIDQLNPVDKQRIIREIQTATADLPSKAQIDNLIQQSAVSGGQTFQQLTALADSIPDNLKYNLDNIMKEIRETIRVQDVVSQEIGQVKELVVNLGKKKNEWDGSFIDNPEDWNSLTLQGKKEFLRSRFDAGEALELSGDVLTASKVSTLRLKDADIVFENWLNNLINMPSPPSAVYNPSASIVSSSTYAPSQVSNITPTGIAETFQRTIGKEGKGIKKRLMGKGISVKETPSYREYGKYAIHLPQLEQQDMLNVKYKSLGQIPKFKPIPVSDIFRDFIIDLLDNGKPNVRVYTQIAPEERKFFEEMSIGAGVWNGLGLKRTTTSTDEEENKRFELLKGEYIAGNNNPKVIGELRRLVVKMISDGRIRKSQGIELLMELSI